MISALARAGSRAGSPPRTARQWGLCELADLIDAECERRALNRASRPAPAPSSSKLLINVQKSGQIRFAMPKSLLPSLQPPHFPRSHEWRVSL